MTSIHPTSKDAYVASTKPITTSREALLFSLLKQDSLAASALRELLLFSDNPKVKLITLQTLESLFLALKPKEERTHSCAFFKFDDEVQAEILKGLKNQIQASFLCDPKFYLSTQDQYNQENLDHAIIIYQSALFTCMPKKDQLNVVRMTSFFKEQFKPAIQIYDIYNRLIATDCLEFKPLCNTSEDEKKRILSGGIITRYLNMLNENFEWLIKNRIQAQKCEQLTKTTQEDRQADLDDLEKLELFNHNLRQDMFPLHFEHTIVSTKKISFDFFNNQTTRIPFFIGRFLGHDKATEYTVAFKNGFNHTQQIRIIIPEQNKTPDLALLPLHPLIQALSRIELADLKEHQTIVIAPYSYQMIYSDFPGGLAVASAEKNNTTVFYPRSFYLNHDEQDIMMSVLSSVILHETGHHKTCLSAAWTKQWKALYTAAIEEENQDCLFNDQKDFPSVYSRQAFFKGNKEEDPAELYERLKIALVIERYAVKNTGHCVGVLAFLFKRFKKRLQVLTDYLKSKNEYPEDLERLINQSTSTLKWQQFIENPKSMSLLLLQKPISMAVKKSD